MVYYEVARKGNTLVCSLILKGVEMYLLAVEGDKMQRGRVTINKNTRHFYILGLNEDEAKIGKN